MTSRKTEPALVVFLALYCLAVVIAQWAPIGDDGAEAPVVAASDGAECPTDAAADVAANLLTNPSFEEGTTLATGWTDESTTTGRPVYSVSASPWVVDRTRAQRMTYAGRPGDDGTKKAQFFQAPVRGVAPGQTVRFSLCVFAAGAVSDSMVDAYALIGVEAFLIDGTYLSDVVTNITSINEEPTQYDIDYTVPDGSSYIAVFVQSPEFLESSSIDLWFDRATLIILG